MGRDDKEELEALRLADYSEAVKRGKNLPFEGIDPLEAAIIRRLDALGRASTPSPAYLARAQNPFLRQSVQRNQTQVEKTTEVSPLAPSFSRSETTSSDRAGQSPAETTADSNIREFRPPSRFERVWRSKSAIVAGLALLLASVALIVLLAIYL